MSSRRSGRSKAPVKYTSDSDPGSDFTGSKKSKKSAPKKRTKEPVDADAAPPKKRAKRDPETLAAEHKEKAQAQTSKAEKAAHKKAWDAWLESHDAAGALLDEEPAKDVSITQTDAGKKYGVKKEDLAALRHFEKRNPVHNNTMKLYVEEDVKELGFRKLGMLEGVGEGEAVEEGGKIWEEEHKDDPAEDSKPEKKAPAKASSKPSTKKKWTEYIESRTPREADNLDAEPEHAITQTDGTKKYKLQAKELAILPHFAKPNPKYGNQSKLFKEDDVKELAWRKTAVIGGVEEEDEEQLLEKGREMWEAENGEPEEEE